MERGRKRGERGRGRKIKREEEREKRREREKKRRERDEKCVISLFIKAIKSHKQVLSVAQSSTNP